MELVFVADPMCSWCYGFAKELELLLDRYRSASLSITVGGVRAGATDVLDDAGKQFRLRHWAKVEHASGVVFNREGFLGKSGFVYDTEPVCRAVVAARILRPTVDLLKVFRAFQRAFYVAAVDTTDGAVLAETGSQALFEAGQPVTAEEFLETWKQRTTLEETATDFAIARAIGVTSFPALFLRRGGALASVSNGFATAAEVETRLKSLGALRSNEIG